MTTEQFWALIEKAAKAAVGSNEEFLDAMLAALEDLEPEMLVGFQTRFDECMAASYTWDLWGAAYIIQGGCSDDMFDYFRAWLISLGEKTFKAALADADSLAKLKIEDPEACELEEFMYLCAEVFEEKSDDDFYDKLPKPARPADPAGQPWDEDGDDLAERFPKLWKKYSS